MRASNISCLLLLMLNTNPNISIIKNSKISLAQIGHNWYTKIYQIYPTGHLRYLSDISNTAHRIYISDIYQIWKLEDSHPCQLTESLPSLSPVSAPFYSEWICKRQEMGFFCISIGSNLMYFPISIIKKKSNFQYR